MKRLLGFVVVALVVGLASRVAAKGPTVKLTITGPHLSKPLDVTNPRALVNVWSGTRAAESWWDFPKPFIGRVTTEPDAALPQYTVSFYVNAFDEPPHARVLYIVRYVPDPETGLGYVYLPVKGDADGQFNGVINRPGQDGKWSYASQEWSSLINSQLAAAAR